MGKRKFGELELEILHILKADKRMTVKEVLHILGEENKYNTIMTVMNRLVEKKILAREKMGLQYEYYILSDAKKIPSILDQLKNKLFLSKTKDVICYLLESTQDISDQELVEMEELIKKAREERKPHD